MTWATEFQVFIPGKPQTKGSAKAFPFKRKDGSLGVSVTNDNAKSKPWQEAISAAVKADLAKRRHGAKYRHAEELYTGPVSLSIQIVVQRPKSHLSKDGSVKPRQPSFPLVKPDMDKVERAILDGLTGVFYEDDNQVVHKRTTKIYADAANPLGVWIEGSAFLGSWRT